MGAGEHEGPRSPGEGVERLYRAEGGRTPVAWGFLALCLLVTVPTLLRPELYGVLGGLAPREHPWQPFTAAFEHGWPGFPGAAHLALNAFLIVECGRPCERLLGSGRFLFLCVLALLAGAAGIVLTDGVNGASLVIWAWGPPLFVALLRARREGVGLESAAFRRLRGILVLMYGVVTAAMWALPYLSGWRGDPLRAFWMGNRHHLIATAVGVLFAGFVAGGRRSAAEAGAD